MYARKGDLAHHERVIADHLLIGQGDIGLRCFGLLVLEGVAIEKAIQSLLAAIKIINLVAPLELFNSERRHYMRPRSKTLDSLRSLARRRDGRGGASSAFWKASHCALFNPKSCRSGRVSSARARALSSTNSLTERCMADAAVCRICFADLVSRISTFSLRVSICAMKSSLMNCRPTIQS